MKEKHWYAMYGSVEDDISSIAESVANAIETPMQARHSSYIGDYWMASPNMSHDSLKSEIRIRMNYDPQFGGLEEPDHPQFPILVYISRVSDIDSLDKKLISLNLQRLAAKLL
ncbi:hypothetical protein Dalu01_02487 [Deinococcus aluminii]|uniref:Uncharacterized protein n=1 Tax=Deinococcus aluminii TaxID=1656885 RepID=A0ABP9XFF6_9DEIO